MPNQTQLLARVTVANKSVLVNPSKIGEALQQLQGSPKAGRRVEAKIEYEAVQPVMDFPESIQSTRLVYAISYLRMLKQENRTN